MRSYKLAYGTVRLTDRTVIHALRVVDAILDYPEVEQVLERMRSRALSRTGEQAPSIVLIQGDSKETLRLFGDAYAVRRVRAAMFNAALTLTPIELD